MPKKIFAEFAARIQEHFVQETFAEGLVLLNANLESFPEQQPLVNFWKICLTAGSGEAQQANRLLWEVLSGGTWYAQTLLSQSLSLKNMQKDAEFERLTAISQKMQAADPTANLPVYIVRPEEACAPGSPGCAAMVFLHGNQESAHAHLEYWRGLPDQGWLLALPQSSHALWNGAHSWVDSGSAAEEIKTHYQSLAAQYSLDLKRLTIGGMGMGAEIALELALNGSLPAQGFILINPSGPHMETPSTWLKLIEKNKNINLRGVILAANQADGTPNPDAGKLAEMLNSVEISCQLKSYAQPGKAYPDDFGDHLNDALTFIFG